MEKVIFTADLHGNMDQYERVLAYSEKTRADIVVFGGDLTPKTSEQRTPAGQKAFLTQELFPLLAKFRKENDTHVLLIMGNDDFKSNHDVMVDGQDFYGYRMIDQIPYVTKSGYTIVGYTPVPFTPFKFKCWERRDRAEDASIGDRDDARMDGVISRGEELVPYSLKDAFALPSIAEDLAKLTNGINRDKLVLVTHAPPHGTVCDLNREGRHIGSKAVREFIEREQPFATLHGHVHETVDLSGTYIEKLGRTFCLAVGNDNRPRNPYIIDMILGSEFKVERLGVSL